MKWLVLQTVSEGSSKIYTEGLVHAALWFQEPALEGRHTVRHLERLMAEALISKRFCIFQVIFSGRVGFFSS